MNKKEELLYIEDELGGYICTRDYVSNNYAYLVGDICCRGTREELEKYLNITITDNMIRVR